MIGTAPASSITVSCCGEEPTLFWVKVKLVPKVLQQGTDSEANLTSTKLRNTFGDNVTPGQFQSYITLITSKSTEEETAEHVIDTVGVGRIPSKAQDSWAPCDISVSLLLWQHCYQRQTVLEFLSTNSSQCAVKVLKQFLTTETVCPVVLGCNFFSSAHFLLVQHFSAAVVLT